LLCLTLSLPNLHQAFNLGRKIESSLMEISSQDMK
jgi:hypothetical protein